MSDAPIKDPVPRRIEDAEATAYPWWCIIDPAKLTLPSPEDVARQLREVPTERTDYRNDVTAEDLTGVFTGPFLSRDTAEAHLKAQRHRYSDRAQVWCLSGHASRDWRDLCREAPRV